MIIKKTLTSLVLTLLPCAVIAAPEPDYFALSIEQLLELEVDSASGVSEQLKQTPTPVSVITEQMIKQSGVNTLRDLLSLYIPNFTQVQDHNEYNVAFRGVYTSSQQKFLILLNGHRLNSRAFAMASPDLAIALEKVKHIEVLRGPGSSVHGNAALTSVINIVSKTGDEFDTVKVSVEAGNHGYRDAFIEAGANYQNLNWYAWFKYAEASGEPWSITPEQDYSANPVERTTTSYLDAFTNEPAFDYGITVNSSSNWQLLLNYRQSHYTEPLTTGGSSGAAYQAGTVPLIDGVGPGAQSEWFHSYFSKNWQLDGQQQVKLKLYYDTNYTLGVITNKEQGFSFADFLGSEQQLTFSTIAWDDKDLGFSAQWQKQFTDTTLLAGVDYDYMKVTDSKAFTGSQGHVSSELTFNGKGLLPKGSEYIWSSYLQVKTELQQDWLLNAGVRYDHKTRRDGTSITELSPRLALIRESQDKVMKLSYAKSFVDPAYWNRYSSLPAFRGASDLSPEMLESIQFTPEFYWLDNSLQLKLNLYYNRYKDVVFRQVTALQNDALFTNAGQITTAGLEQELSYHFDDKVVRVVASQNQVRQIRHYPSSEDEIFNIPNYQLNLIFDHSLSQQLEYQVSAKYMGKRLSPINIAQDGATVADPYPDSGVDFFAPDNELGGHVLFNAHINWQLTNLPITMSLNVQNLFDKAWYQGGSVAHPYRQTGRWFKLGIEYKFQ